MDDRVLLVTGGSAGSGAAIARLAASEGWRIALNHRDSAPQAKKVADQIRQIGGAVDIYQADVADPHALHAMFEAIDANTPVLSGLVNNAGIVAPSSKVAGIDHARLRRMFDVNVIGAISVAREAAARMGPGSSIVNVSSAAARLGSANQYVDYAASKAAIDTFTKGFADELARDGIRVNSLRPGIILTEIHAKGGEPDRASRLGPAVPMGRAGTAEEVAEGILWRLSDKSSYVTGTTLDVTGGR